MSEQDIKDVVAYLNMLTHGLVPAGTTREAVAAVLPAAGIVNYSVFYGQ
jgi:hypothetical protein